MRGVAALGLPSHTPPHRLPSLLRLQAPPLSGSFPPMENMLSPSPPLPATHPSWATRSLDKRQIDGWKQKGNICSAQINI